MTETHLDHPGEVTWFAGFGPLPATEPCPHTDCTHDLGRVIAWGPNFEHYSLVMCTTPDGCNGACRGWTTEYPYGEGPQFRQGPFKLTVQPEDMTPEAQLQWVRVTLENMLREFRTADQQRRFYIVRDGINGILSEIPKADS